MTSVFGIFCRDGQPVKREDLEKMEKAFAFVRAEKREQKIIENVGFGWLLTHNTPESKMEQMPRWLPEQRILFMAKGRLDNRSELINLLSIPSNEKETITDGELMLRAYLQFGEKVMDRLLGDWLLIAFSVENQELFIARDHHGYTSLNYYVDEKKVVFATSIKPLLDLDFIPKKVDEDLLSRLMLVIPGDTSKSFFENIRILPPAHTLKVNREKMECKRYWFPENIPINKSRKIDEVVSEFSDIFATAVKDRLRCHAPVASMLSGGLDSGTVSHIASELLKKEGKKLHTFSHVSLYEPSSILSKRSFGDETPQILAGVKASGNIEPTLLKSREISPINGGKRLISILKNPVHAMLNAYWLIDLPEQVEKGGFGALLSGEHGNATISFTGLQESLPFAYFQKKYGLRRSIKKKILRPMLLKYGKNIYLKRKLGVKQIQKQSYVRSEYLKKMDLPGLVQEEGKHDIFTYNFVNGQQKMLRILQPGENLRCYVGSIIGEHFNIEFRDPTADKRVVEYVLSIPDQLFFDQEGNNKQVLKKMMQGKMADEVLFSKQKGKQSGDIGLRLAANPQEMEDLLKEVSKSEIAKEVLDFQRIWQDWEKFLSTKNNAYDVDAIHHLLRNVFAIYFMENFRDFI